MNKRAWPLMLLLSLFGANAGASSLPESHEGVRYEAHTDIEGFRLVARGRPGQSPQALSNALEARARAICADSKPISQPKETEYEYLEGGTKFLMPAGGAFIPLTTYSNVRMAPSSNAVFTCTQTVAVAPTAGLRVVIENQLGETIAYIDQGFASFNRERLDVLIGGAPMARVIRDAVVEALAARGYATEVLDTPNLTAGRIVVAKASVPQEQFDGVAMLTKIGLLGIQNLSAAFCSIQVAVNASGGNKPLATGGVSTRQMLPAIYSSWKKDMAEGPSPSTHEKTSALLARTLATNVKAAIHALPASAIQSLLAPNAQ
ncbi:hypothetical protein [Roseateles asaccharophilus]|uniref:Uncharacterized protein n=1 Tax=Roseateles asaccharophilus TaxID=582607 RepID=A0ABU2ADV0_9BURK|nr:hypothetical protein [Roseateles asaccharophilus]MDR7335378.1 hypothetical protein [Roseateles asaccharophilus]